MRYDPAIFVEKRNIPSIPLHEHMADATIMSVSVARNYVIRPRKEAR